LAVKTKRVKLKRPVLLAPVKSTVIDTATGKPRKSPIGSGIMEVWVCPYCYTWRSARKHIADCCARHHAKLLDTWGSMVADGIIEDPEPTYRGHLPIKTFGDDEAHFVGGHDGRYLLELPDGSHYSPSEATLAVEANHAQAPLLKRALKKWPKGARGRKE